MKKLFLLLLFLIQTTAYAGTISLGTISADATIGGFNDNFTVIANAINGQIQGSGTNGSTTNILADSLGELDMADEINPRLRDSELLGITTDSTTVSNAFVDDGLTPADSANLTSDISAGTAYINGYRVDKSATSRSYTASRDTYVDLSQTGTFTYSEVAVGATAPAVAANSARLARVTTDGTEITTVTDLANRRIPGLIIPGQYRSGLVVSRDSTTTIRVFPGTCEINNTMVSKTSATTLTLTTAGDWAGGSSLQAVSTYGYVGMDASGNLKMHTTAPTHDNYGVSTTAGKKRYATWSSTVYRILGWFFMNATGSGELNSYEVGNIKEGDVSNTNQLSSITQVSTTSVNPTADTQAIMRFYSSGGPVKIDYNAGVAAGTSDRTGILIQVDSTNKTDSLRERAGTTNTNAIFNNYTEWTETYSQATHTIQGMFSADTGTVYINRRQVIVEEK